MKDLRMRYERKCEHGSWYGDGDSCPPDCKGGESGLARIAFLAETVTDNDGATYETYIVTIPGQSLLGDRAK